jgi:hypothetical protein
MTILRKLLISLFATAMISTSVLAGSFGVGASGSFAVISAEGTEKDKDAAADTSNRKANANNTAIIGSFFAEYIFDNGLTFGFDMIPGEADVNQSRISRTDANPLAQVPVDTADDITRSAQATISDVITYYADVPVGGSGLYGKVGWTQMDVTTLEVMKTGQSYGNTNVDGIMLGVGMKQNIEGSGMYYKIEGSYTDFETLNLNDAQTDVGNKISADLDVTKLTVALGYAF